MVFIRAPAWGATGSSWTIMAATAFLSAPPRGGRRAADQRPDQAGGFYPRPRVGGDPVTPFGRRWLGFLSAPPRGGRHVRPSVHGSALTFLSAPPRGGRLPENLHAYVGLTFLSAPPRGGRPQVGFYAEARGCFYPRPRVGGDISPARAGARGGVSIRAPAWGATTGQFRLEAGDWFLSAPPRGGRRPRLGLPCRCARVSIRAPAWGAT